MPRAEFEPATPATKRPQTYALDRAVINGVLFSGERHWIGVLEPLFVNYKRILTIIQIHATNFYYFRMIFGVGYVLMKSTTMSGSFITTEPSSSGIVKHEFRYLPFKNVLFISIFEYHLTNLNFRLIHTTLSHMSCISEDTEPEISES
jgi:hypothetical protein